MNLTTASRSAPIDIGPTLGVLAGALLWLGCTAWLRPLFLPDEGRYVGVAWEMLRSGDWFTPTLDGMPFFHKPPLFYWLTAAALQVFGANEWAARLASVLAASATVTALYLFVRRWLGERRARLAAVVLATQPLFFVGAQFANLDMLVAACISISILLGAHAVFRFEAGEPRWASLAGLYVGVALGVLAKGLIGLVLPALVLFLWLAARRRWRAMGSLLWPPGLVIALALLLPWFAVMQHRHADFLHYFFVVQQFQRYAQGGFNGVAPFWFYGPVLLVFCLPWSGWLSLALARQRAVAADPLGTRALMWTWLVVVVVFFSLPQSKLIGYVLPALVPLAFLIAHCAAPEIGTSVRATRAWWASAGLAVCLCVGVVIGFSLNHPKSSRELAHALAARHATGESIVFLDEYPYDLAFYLQGSTAFPVVSDWASAEIAMDDNWRKELLDAARFAPTLAPDRLWNEAQFKAAVCGPKVVWVVASLDQLQRYPFLAQAERVAMNFGRAVWRLDSSAADLRAAAGCPALARVRS